MKKGLNVLMLLIFISSISSCEKYEDGGVVGDTERNIKTRWKLIKYIRNGNDETKSLLFYNYVETFSDEWKYSRTYMADGNKPMSESGTWSFNKGEKQINLTGVPPLDIIPPHKGVSITSFKILRLQDNEMWYTFTSGGDMHQFRLIK